MLKFQNKISLITGSGTGIGQAIAKKFVENGASVIILGRRKEPLDETAKMLKSIIAEKGQGSKLAYQFLVSPFFVTFVQY